MIENLSVHAARRCQQRGISQDEIERVIAQHDIDHEIGGDCRALRISRAAMRAGKIDCGAIQHRERLTNLIVVWSDRSSQVVTAFHGHNRRVMRRYLGRG